MLTHATTAGKGTAIVSVCPKCGTIRRSGKSSCCGRGGSWFGNCGSADSTKVEHRWYEGLEACKTRTQLKTVSGEESNAGEQRNTHNDVGIENSKAVIVVAKPFELISTLPIVVTNHSIGAIGKRTTSNDKSTNMNSCTETKNTVSIVSALIDVLPGHASTSNTLLSVLLNRRTHTNMLTPTTTAVDTMTTTMVTRTTQDATIDWISQGMSCAHCIWIHDETCCAFITRCTFILMQNNSDLLCSCLSTVGLYADLVLVGAVLSCVVLFVLPSSLTAG